MRILMSIHHELNPDQGAPGVTCSLAQAFSEVGCPTKILSFSSMKGWARGLPTKVKPVAYPWHIATQLQKLLGDYDVADLSSGDGWLYQSLRPSPTKLYVTRSHGLEHIGCDDLVEQARQGRIRLSWKFPLYHGGYRLWEIQRSYASADLSVFLSQWERDYAVEHMALDLRKTAVVDNGVRDEILGRKFHPKNTSADGKFRIVLLGSYLPHKMGIAPVALDRLLERHQNLEISFLGTGAPKERILTDFRETLHSRITVIPRFQNHELPELLRCYHLLLFPSLFEGSPLSVYEAMACGLAVVASRLPTLEERLQHERNVLFVPPNDAPAIEAAVERLMADPTLLRTLQEQGHARAQDFSWSRIAGDIVSLYSEFLERKRKSVS
jgi:glycosyltransferase involved in cell wall biosynthesis